MGIDLVHLQKVEEKIYLDVQWLQELVVTQKNYSSVMNFLYLNYECLASLSYFLHSDLEKTRDYLYAAASARLHICKTYHAAQIPVDMCYVGASNTGKAWQALIAGAPDIALSILNASDFEHPNKARETLFWKMACKYSIAILLGDKECAQQCCNVMKGEEGKRTKIRQVHQPYLAAFQAILDGDSSALEATAVGMAKTNHTIVNGVNSYYPYYYVLGVFKMAQICGVKVQIDNSHYPQSLLHLPPSDFAHIDQWWNQLEIKVVE